MMRYERWRARMRLETLSSAEAPPSAILRASKSQFCAAAACARSSDRRTSVKTRPRSVRHREQQDGDPECGSAWRELVEELRAFTVPLPRIGHVGVVRHQHHDAAV